MLMLAKMGLLRAGSVPEIIDPDFSDNFAGYSSATNPPTGWFDASSQPPSPPYGVIYPSSSAGSDGTPSVSLYLEKGEYCNNDECTSTSFLTIYAAIYRFIPSRGHNRLEVVSSMSTSTYQAAWGVNLNGTIYQFDATYGGVAPVSNVSVGGGFRKYTWVVPSGTALTTFLGFQGTYSWIMPNNANFTMNIDSVRTYRQL